jgi:sugar phosphate isomerase/epimerase
MARIPVSVQLYSVRDDAKNDLSGVLKAIAKMGYDGVEFAGFYGHDAKSVRAMLDEYGLKASGAHVGMETLMGDELAASIEFHQTIGNQFLIVPGLNHHYTTSRAGWLQAAHILNDVSKQLAPHGMQTGYHNHWIEFSELDGELPWDTFFGNTDQAVIMQFDTGNALLGGADAAPFLQRYPGRALSVHLKEHSHTNDKALLGEGDVPWEYVLNLCETVGGTQWYVVEQESYAYPPMECIDRCLQNLRGMGR